MAQTPGNRSRILRSTWPGRPESPSTPATPESSTRVHRGSAHRRPPQLRWGRDLEPHQSPGADPGPALRSSECRPPLRDHDCGPPRDHQSRRVLAAAVGETGSVSPRNRPGRFRSSVHALGWSRLRQLGWGRDGDPLSGGAFGGSVATITASGPGVVLAGSARGVSRSEDAGRRWAAANRGIHEVSVRSLAIDPIDPEVVFAASHGGIYQSSNGGETWIEPSAQSPTPRSLRSIHRIVRRFMQPGAAESTRARTGAERGRTTDGSTEYVADLVIDPNNPRRLFAPHTRASTGAWTGRTAGEYS